MTEIVKVAGRAKVAHLDGKTIYREDRILVKSDNAVYPTSDTFAHFVYRQNWKPGPMLMCTCGSPAGAYNYEAYARFSNINMGAVVFCNSLVNNGYHADGSTE